MSRRASVVDRLARLLAQALALGAEHQRDLLARQSLFEFGRAFRIKPDGLEAGVVQLVRARRRGWSPRYRSMCSSAPEADFASTPDSVGLWRCGGDQRAGVEGDGRAHDGADIVRIGHLVEHQHQRAVAQARRGAWAQRPASSSTPWWMASRPVTLSMSCGATSLGLEGQSGEIGDLEPLQRIARHQQLADLALGIVECGAHRMQAVEPHQAVGWRLRPAALVGVGG